MRGCRTEQNGNGGERGYQLPPTSLMALSSAFLEAVRRVPLLRGMSASVMPSSARRRAILRPSSSSVIGSGVEVVDAIIACRFVADASLHIVEIEVFGQSEEGAGLIQHIRRGARGILAHAVSYDVLCRDDFDNTAVAYADRSDALPFCLSIEEGGRNDFKAEFQVRVNPAARRHARTGGAHETVLDKNIFEAGLGAGYNVKVASVDAAKGVHLDRRAADEDGARQVAR